MYKEVKKFFSNPEYYITGKKLLARLAELGISLHKSKGTVLVQFDEVGRLTRDAYPATTEGIMEVLKGSKGVKTLKKGNPYTIQGGETSADKLRRLTHANKKFVCISPGWDAIFEKIFKMEFRYNSEGRFGYNGYGPSVAKDRISQGTEWAWTYYHRSPEGKWSFVRVKDGGWRENSHQKFEIEEETQKKQLEWLWRNHPDFEEKWLSEPLTQKVS